MERYEKYKDSGVEWIGEIPEGWRVKKLKYVVSKIGSGVTPKGGANVYQLRGVPLLRSQNIHFDGLKMDDVAYIDEDVHESMVNSKVQPGDVLLNITGASIGRCFYADNMLGEANVNQHVCIVRPTNKIATSYLYFFFRSDFGQKQIDVEQTGSGREGLNFEALNNFLIPYIPLTEQTAIANYLDRKTAEIDALIAQKERLIALYEEEKAAIINQAVTQGIDPNAKLKDSGIDWLGEIPQHWEIKRLRYIGSCQNGISQSADYFGQGFPFVSYGDVYKNIVLPKNVDGLANSTESDRNNYSVFKGDVFFTRTSETIEEIGIASTCSKTIKDAVFSGFLIRFRASSNDLFDGFSKYYFRASIHRIFFVKEMNLVTRASLSQELLKKLPVLLPPIQEQIEINKYIEIEIARIDAKIAKTQRIIELQKEYRTALISEVVTGKIKVSHLVDKEIAQ